MFKARFAAVLVVLSASVCTCWSQPSQSPEPVYQVAGMPVEVAEIMTSQLESWNASDLVGFMKGYWEHDSLMFVGSTGLTRGHRATLDRYIKSYPNAQAMGKLTFVNQEWIPLGMDAGWLLGSWHLEKEGLEDAQGMYTLLWRKLEGAWVIVADHSS
jgi:hypothetical protein